MSEKIYNLEDIRQLVPEDGELDYGKDGDYVSVRRWAADHAGTFIWKAFKKVADGYVEVDFMKDVKQAAVFLAKSIDTKRLLHEVLLKVRFSDLVDLKERIEKTPKVTVGVQRGSCVYLYIRGKRGQPAQLQLTE